MHRPRILWGSNIGREICRFKIKISICLRDPQDESLGTNWQAYFSLLVQVSSPFYLLFLRSPLKDQKHIAKFEGKEQFPPHPSAYEGGPKNNRNLNVARELEVAARCAANCR